MNNNERELKWLLEKCQVDGGLNLADRQRYMELSGQLGITTERAKHIYEDLSLVNLHVAQKEEQARISSASRNVTEGDITDAVKLANEAIGKDRAERSVSSSSKPAGVPGMDPETAKFLEGLNAGRTPKNPTGRN